MDLQDAMAAPISVPRRGHVSGTDRPSALTAAVRLPSNARFEKLIAAIAERVLECSASHVVLVPHDELAYLPFWSLARPMPQVAISICQGANALLLFRRRKRDRNGTHIAVGDVTGTLEYTRPEIESLAGFIPEEPVKKAILGRLTFASMIQFAGHGIFNARRPYESGLFIRGDGQLYEQLTLLDVMRAYAPRCYLAVLSACCSGRALVIARGRLSPLTYDEVVASSVVRNMSPSIHIRIPDLPALQRSSTSVPTS
jgi:CHAT domain-containing protein